MWRKLDPTPPHINMQSRPTGTIPVRIKCCVLVFKRTMPGRKVQGADVRRELHRYRLEVTGRVYEHYTGNRGLSNTQLLSVHMEAQGSRMT